jgi:cell division transport system ATP-binding protein
MSLLRFDSVSKKYGDHFALSDISFEIKSGEFVFLVGPSGAGKSTIAKLITREINPSAGSVFFNDTNLSNLTDENLPELRRNIAVIFQDFKLLEEKSVFDNVAISLEVVNAPDHAIKEIVPNVLGLVKLDHKMDTPTQDLSGGEKQRLSIARALAHEPTLILADEPTGMIDPEASVELVEIFEKINKMGTSVLMATHDKDIVDKFKKRVIKITNGYLDFDRENSKYDG